MVLKLSNQNQVCGSGSGFQNRVGSGSGFKILVETGSGPNIKILNYSKVELFLQYLLTKFLDTKYIVEKKVKVEFYQVSLGKIRIRIWGFQWSDPDLVFFLEGGISIRFFSQVRSESDFSRSWGPGKTQPEPQPPWFEVRNEIRLTLRLMKWNGDKNTSLSFPPAKPWYLY